MVRRVVATVRRGLCFCEKRSKDAPKARATGAPFTGRAANQEPALAEPTLQCRLKERNDEHDACMNTARLRRGACGTPHGTHARGGMTGRGDAPIAWNGCGW